MRFTLMLAFLTAWNFNAVSAHAAGYSYPYPDPYLATATTAILSGNGSCVESSILRIPGLPGRNELPTLEGRGNVSLALYQHRRPAPLLFILAGLGANPYFGVAPYLSELFYREGFHVVVVPSPMSWNFALSASRLGAPGFAPTDARDVYEVMQKTLVTLKNRHGRAITTTHFMGVSLGALQGAYVSAIDAEEKKIGIARYLLVNPPVNLAYAVNKIDQWSTISKKFGREKSKQLVARALGIVDAFSYEPGDDPRIFDRFVKRFDVFTMEEIQLLVAENLQSQFPELIYVTQLIHDQNLLSGPTNAVRKRLTEARGFSFSDYNRKIALPLWRKQLGDPRADLETFIENGSLRRILDRLRGDTRVHIMHNTDDFLSDRKAVEELKRTLGDRMTLYPRGGHLGNLWFPVNQADALRFFRSG